MRVEEERAVHLRENFFMEFSILESTGTTQKGKAMKFPFSLHDQPKVAEIHMRTFAGFSRILEHVSVCSPRSSPAPPEKQPPLNQGAPAIPCKSEWVGNLFLAQFASKSSFLLALKCPENKKFPSAACILPPFLLITALFHNWF